MKKGNYRMLVRNLREIEEVKCIKQLKRNKTCFMCGEEKPNDGHTSCEDCGGVSF